MTDAAPTVGELFKAKSATDEQVYAAIEAYLKDPGTYEHLIAEGYGIDIAAAVLGQAWASQIVGLIESSQNLKRGAVRPEDLRRAALWSPELT
ncbi:conserved protein of unknown function [Methylorubrum extorquens]|uniref:Uncharacterized protein n=1 Tax=Methylorubrum extorquens TaxID=408 RepID=A0A2N9AYL4_METEX|nr:hypothetical protein [Methylobacterium sp. Leaf122]KQQ18590.1 hypothetical protein ASF56_22445 [Methylobacterium sp. Leaf122]SOR32414.1 conserved protein of unknown function [Methylorubrum extorquens]